MHLVDQNKYKLVRADKLGENICSGCTFDTGEELDDSLITCSLLKEYPDNNGESLGCSISGVHYIYLKSLKHTLKEL